MSAKPWGKKPVAYFQGHYKHICKKHKIPLFKYASLETDNDLGPDTRKAIKELKKVFGITPVTDKLSEEFLLMVRSPFKGPLFTAPRRARGSAYRAKVRRAHSKRLKEAAQGSLGEKALRAGRKMLGKVETGNNDAPWLRSMEKTLVDAGEPLAWMIPGNPYCGFGVIWSYWVGAKVFLPANFVGTTNICPAGGKVFKGTPGIDYRLTRIPLESVRKGDILVFDWAPGSGADHTGLARGPMKGGSIPTTEFNTSPTNAGSQSNGGGVWDRTRSRGNIICAIRVTPA